LLIKKVSGNGLPRKGRKGSRIVKKREPQQNLNIKGPRLLPLKKAAEYLGLTVWAMRERIWAGQIPVVRFPGGRKMYIDIQDIEDFIRRNKMTIT
jgi:hypothetical protein